MTDQRDRSRERKYFRGRTGVTVSLSCGCRVRARSVPMPGAPMVCTSGLGHGYRLKWTEAVNETGFVFTNQRDGKGK